MAIRIQIRRATAAEWTAFDPVLGIGEMGLEYDTVKIKIGDGATIWSLLPYYAMVGATGPTGAGVTGSTGPSGPTGTSITGPTEPL